MFRRGTFVLLGRYSICFYADMTLFISVDFKLETLSVPVQTRRLTNCRFIEISGSLTNFDNSITRIITRPKSFFFKTLHSQPYRQNQVKNRQFFQTIDDSSFTMNDSPFSIKILI